MSETFTMAIKIVPTMANLFGCHHNLFGCHHDVLIIDQLCQISDLAANVRISLRKGDIDLAADEMGLSFESFMHFVEWTHTDEED